MVLISLVACLAIQRWLEWDKYKRNNHWFDAYYAWWESRLGTKKLWAGFLGLCIIILPVLIIYAVLSTVVYHLFTVAGYVVLNFIVLLYFLDSRPIHSQVADSEMHEVFISIYQNIFAVIFWFLILGGTGVILYSLLMRVTKNPAMEIPARKVLSVLDWIPVRLLGITYALAGHFRAVFKLWYDRVFSGLTPIPELAALCALAALGEGESDINSLINRALGIWLFIIAIFTIGVWIGG